MKKTAADQVVDQVQVQVQDAVWYCDPYDRASIRAATLGALAAPAPAGLRERLQAEFSWPAVAAANVTLYEETLRLHRVHHR